MSSNVPNLTLNNGVQIPQVGFGTWRLEPDDAYCAVLCALSQGYRSIDTAAMYFNEEAVGRAIADSGVPRNEIFLTTKLSNWERTADLARKGFERSLKELHVDSVDLYLIHWPGTPDLFLPTWRALEEIYREGRVRAIGVSNFLAHHLETLAQETDIVPAVDQIECHPYLYQQETIEYCNAHGIVVEAWSPLMSGSAALTDPVICAIAQETGHDNAQVILRWHIQHGRRVLPRTTNPDHSLSNLSLFDFTLTQEQMARIDALSVHNQRGGHPDEVHLTLDIPAFAIGKIKP